MALPSPVAAIPDMNPVISQAQARANSLLQSAWMGLAGMGQPPAQAAQPAAAQAPPGAGQAPADGTITSSLQSWNQPAQGYSGATGDDLDLLARTIQAEAGGESYEGQLAVGAVIGNRARSGKYGGSTLRDVIMAPGQFSAWNGVTGYAGGKGALDMNKIRPSETALRVAQTILAGGYQDPTGGATHYYNPSVATPKWGQAAGGQWKTIGNHIFGFADGRPGAHPKGRS